MIIAVLVSMGVVVILALGVALVRRKAGSWLYPLIVHEYKTPPRRLDPRAEVHVILAIADHYEPNFGGASKELAQARVDRWVSDYPRVLGHFRDSDGRPPRHTFFYPVEAYDHDEVEGIAQLCRAGFGELEVHLHHNQDTAENLAHTLREAVRILSVEHGLLSRDRVTGELGYAFVHGNWVLNNSHPNGDWCGVNDEIRVLRETGCYADFTFPSAPSPPAPCMINQIYRAESTPDRPFGHDHGVVVGSASRSSSVSSDALMLIQGPLVLNWRNRKWGLIPRLENGCVQSSQPASASRLPLWLKAGVGVPSRPDWIFVKLHAHGAPSHDHPALIGEPMAVFHQELADLAEENPRFHYHYVTAREMYNLVRAAESGWTGDVDSARDFERVWEPQVSEIKKMPTHMVK